MVLGTATGTHGTPHVNGVIYTGGGWCPHGWRSGYSKPRRVFNYVNCRPSLVSLHGFDGTGDRGLSPDNGSDRARRGVAFTKLAAGRLHFTMPALAAVDYSFGQKIYYLESARGLGLVVPVVFPCGELK